MPCFLDGVPDSGITPVISDHWANEIRYGYNMASVSGTYNGTFCDPATSQIFQANDAVWAAKGFDYLFDAEACICDFEFPLGYKADSDFKIELRWCTLSTGSGNMKWNVGCLFRDDAQSMNVTPTYQSLVQAKPAQYLRQTASFTFTGTNASEGESLGVVVYRDPDDNQDTMNVNAYLFAVSFQAVKDRLGG